MKKIVAFILVLALLAGLSTVALADPNIEGLGWVTDEFLEYYYSLPEDQRDLKVGQLKKQYSEYLKNPMVSYTVRYVDEDNFELVPAKVVDGSRATDVCTENAIAIDGYKIVGDATKSLKLSADESANVITFNYEADVSEYTVRYLEEGTEKTLKPAKVVTDAKVGSIVTEYAAEIDGYELVSENEQDMAIQKDASLNVITFYYKTALTDYTVQYLEVGTDKALVPDKVVTDAKVGSVVTEYAAEIDGYEPIDPNGLALKIEKDASQNVITFYYEHALTDYTVRYLEMGTDKALKTAEVVTGAQVGSVVTEYAAEIDGYELVSENKQDLTIQKDASRNIITFYYKPVEITTVSYTVQYLDFMGYVRHPEKVVTGIVPGTRVIEYPAEVEGAIASLPKIETVIYGGEIIRFMYSDGV